MARYKLLAGTHIESVTNKKGERENKTFNAGTDDNIIEVDHPLDEMFPNKFRKLIGKKSKKRSAEDEDEASEAPTGRESAPGPMSEIQGFEAGEESDDETKENDNNQIKAAGLPDTEPEEEEEEEEGEEGEDETTEDEEEEAEEEEEEKPAKRGSRAKTPPKPAPTKPAVKKGAKTAKEDSRDVTEKFEVAGDNGLTVVQIKGEGFHVLDGNKKLTKSPLSKKGEVDAFLDKHVGE